MLCAIRFNEPCAHSHGDVPDHRRNMQSHGDDPGVKEAGFCRPPRPRNRGSPWPGRVRIRSLTVTSRMQTISDPLSRTRQRQTVNEPETAQVITERIAHVVDLLGTTQAVAEGHAQGVDERVEAVLGRLRRLTADQGETWLARLDELGSPDTKGSMPATSGAAGVTDHPETGSAVLEELAGALAATAAGYIRLHTTARLLFDAATCDLAAEHLRTTDEAIQIINWLLPDVVGRELQAAQGLDCRCVCPACSIGACLCVRNSTDTALHASGAGTPYGTRGLPSPDDLGDRLDRWSLGILTPGRGVVLRSNPRPHSPLAAAGISRDDRILQVGDLDVNSNPEIQDALSAHEPGDGVSLKVKRTRGDTTEFRVRRPST